MAKEFVATVHRRIGGYHEQTAYFRHRGFLAEKDPFSLTAHSLQFTGIHSTKAASDTYLSGILTPTLPDAAAVGSQHNFIYCWLSRSIDHTNYRPESLFRTINKHQQQASQVYIEVPTAGQ